MKSLWLSTENNNIQKYVFSRDVDVGLHFFFLYRAVDSESR